jgi:hypothetical protein
MFDFNTSASNSASDLIQQSLNSYKREKNKNELDKNE